MSTEIYYKAVRPDGTDFYTGKVLWDRVGEIVEHPNPGSPGGGDAEGYLSVSVSPADCTGMEWPCRLLEVEPVYGVPVWEPTPSLPSKRASHAWRVVRELPAHEALGPNGAEVAAFLELLPTLTNAQWDAAGEVTREIAWEDTWEVTRKAAREAVRKVTKFAAKFAAWYAAYALVVRDLITAEKFDTLTAPMRAAGIDFDALTRSDATYNKKPSTKKEPTNERPQVPNVWVRDDPNERRKEMNTVVATRLADANIALDDGGWNYLILKLDEAEALRKLLEEEKDARLGRWRDPENPEWVVYPDGPDRVRVFNEDTCYTKIWANPIDNASGGWDSARVAQRYFDAHPEPKPWHGAQIGEVWWLTRYGTEGSFLVTGDEFISTDLAVVVDLDDDSITAGRRIWPVEEETDQ